MTPVNGEFETEAKSITKSILKVVDGVAQFERVNELLIDVIKFIRANEETYNVQELIDGKVALIITRLITVWSEHISVANEFGQVMNPVAKKTDVLAFKVRTKFKDDIDESVLATVNAELRTDNPNIKFFRELANELPKDYREVLTGKATFRQKQEIIKMFIQGKTTKVGTKYVHTLNDFTPYADLVETMIVDTISSTTELVELELSNKTMVTAMVGAFTNPRLTNTVRLAMEDRLSKCNQVVRDEVAKRLK